jgi:nucleotide-binding universal stress UspA family protein
MITSLLVALDSSAHAKAALDHALELGRVYQARLTGLHVVDVRYLEMPPYLDYSYAFEAVPPTLVPLEMMEKFQAKSLRILADFREVAERAGLQVETRSEEGVPGQVIADVGDSHDLIVMGKRGEHAKWGRDLLGTAAEAVARRSTTPILLAEEQYRPLKRGLLLFDGSHSANQALKLVADIASKTGMQLRVTTVNDDREEGERIIQEARAYLDPLGLQAGYSVVPGRLPKAAAALLANEPADLVILGTRGHSPLRHLILGSTAEQLMRSVELPVLLVP